jgi:cytochrome c5
MNNFSRLSTVLGVSFLLSANSLANHNTPEALEARISAVGQLSIADENTASATTNDGPVDGSAVYAASCGACHGAGVAGAPVLGDADDWAVRIEQGMETLAEHAIVGYQGTMGVMPAKGGNPALSDEEVTAAVQYMVDQVQ